MKKLMMTLLVTVTALSSGLMGCADQDPQTAQASQALSGKELDYEFYSDDTYTQLVGAYFMSCGMNQPDIWGRRTQYVIGSQLTCQTGGTVGCWQIINGQETCMYLSCVICP